MITKKQINWIASRPPEEDFRFVDSFGETIVIVTGAGGVEIQMAEDGTVTAFGMYGAFMWTQDPMPHVA